MLWVDALSINQTDISERGAQVCRMGSIYRKARQVLVWLGPETENSVLGMEYIGLLAKGLQHNYAEHLITTTRGSEAHMLKTNVDILLTKTPHWIAIRDLFCREWFSRLWIFQEIHLARKAVVITGICQVPWDQFLNVYYWIFSNNELRALNIFNSKNLLALGSTVDPLWDTSLSHHHLFERTKDLSCSDPRDRIYALLNLLPYAIRQEIIPDYSRTVGDIYTDFILLSMKDAARPGAHHLRLCILDDTAPDVGMPSWVPDFSKQRPAILFSGLASGRSKHEAEYCGNGVLRVRGVLADRVIRLGDAVPQNSDISATISIMRTWEPPNLSDTYVSGGTVLDAFVTLLVSGNTMELFPDYGNFPSLQECRDAFSYISEWDTRQINTSFVDILQNFLPGRRFFTTSEGYIGLGPSSTMPGDVVCVLLGCSHPLLLRPVHGSSDQYQVVGESYVHGRMHNEVFLGELPKHWTRKYWNRLNDFGESYVNDTGRETVEDPRLSPLPREWCVRYGAGLVLKQRLSLPNQSVKERLLDNLRWASDYVLRNQEFDENGEVRDPWFENLETGECTWADPRLTSNALKEKGVVMKDFFLV